MYPGAVLKPVLHTVCTSRLETAVAAAAEAGRGWTQSPISRAAKSPPARAPLGWARAHAESQYRFITAVNRGEQPSPGIADGLRTQLVIDAVARSAAENGTWVTVEQE